MKKIITNILSLAFICTVVFLPTYLSFAQTGGNSSSGGGPGNPSTGGAGNPSTGGTTQTIKPAIENPFKGGDTLYGLLRTIIDNVLLPIGSILSVLAFIWSGFLYVAAQGNTEKIKKAHNALLYSAIGTAVLFGAWVLTTVIQNTINQLKS